MKAIVRLGALAGATISAISLAGNIVAAVLIVAMAFLIGADVVGRKYFESPIVYTYELVGYTVVACGFFSAAHTLASQRHIRIDLLTGRLPARWQLRLQILTGVLGLIFLAILFWTGAEFVMKAYATKRTIPSVLAPPAYVVQWFIPAGALLTGLQALVELVKGIAKAQVDTAGAPRDCVVTDVVRPAVTMASE